MPYNGCMLKMIDTITISFSDAQCVAIISTWLHGPAGRVWVRRTEQSNALATRWHLTLNEEGADARAEDPQDRDVVTLVDLTPRLIREALAAMLANGTRDEKLIAAKALVEGGGIDNYTADAIVQVAILGKVVFG